MKNLFRILCIFSFGLLVISSCSDDEPSGESIFKTDPKEESEFDTWLNENFADPFNIQILYKMEDLQSNTGFTLAPASIESSKMMAKAIKYLWVEPFIEVNNDPLFVQVHAPRIFHFIGSGGYDNAGTVLAGTAEGGLKITLYRVNDIMNLNLDNIGDYYFKTMYHEYFHILHQKVHFGPDYIKITGNYVEGDWYLYNEQEALNLGFISRYARNNENEDFVEVASIYIVRGQEYWDSQLLKAQGEGRKLLEDKLKYVKNYFKSTWNLDIKEMQKIYQRRAVDLNSILSK